jgi:hypothetical protein
MLAAVAWFCSAGAASAAPPANDDFADASVLTGLPAAATATNESATNEAGEPDHVGVEATPHSVWWSWTAPKDGDVTVDTCSSELRTALAVYTGSSIAALTPVARLPFPPFNCGSGSDGVRVSFHATAGEAYRIAAASLRSDGAAGNIVLVLRTSPKPANDDFANAAPFIEDDGGYGHVTGTNAGASEEPGEPNHAGNDGGRSVWWKWTAPRSGVVTFETCETATLLAVYTGDGVGALREVAALDGGPTCGPGRSVRFRARAGTTYYIAVDTTEGPIDDLYLSKTPTPPNDDFENAAALAGLSASLGTLINFNATSEPGEPNHAGNAAGRSLWWRWKAPKNGLVRVDTCDPSYSSAFDSGLAVYTGDRVDALDAVASNDNSPSCGRWNPSGAAVVFHATAGRTYRIVVDNPPTAALAMFNLKIAETPDPPSPPPPPPPAKAISGATGGNDTLIGTARNDVLCGLGGSDVISGLSGDDTLFGEACPKTRATGAAARDGNDSLFGGAGNDRLYGAGGSDRLFGGPGHDALWGGAGNDLLVGGTGLDQLHGGGGGDRLSGGPADDRLYGGDGADRLQGHGGNDVLQGGKGRDRVWGGPGDDRILVQDGHPDIVSCGPGRDRVSADKQDRLRGCETNRRR